MDPSPASTAQQRFDAAYICSTEVCRHLKVSRASILQARKRGDLPDPVVVNGAQIYLWERHIIQPYIDAWFLRLHRYRPGRAVIT